MIIPKGIEIKMTGSVVTLMRNQICSMNSPRGQGRRKRTWIDSRPIEKSFPISSMNPVVLRPSPKALLAMVQSHPSSTLFSGPRPKAGHSHSVAGREQAGLSGDSKEEFRL